MASSGESPAQVIRLDQKITREDEEEDEEMEKQMDELAHEFVETHDLEIIKELYQLSRELEKVEKE